MKLRLTRLFVLVLTAALVLAACGSQNSSGGATQNTPAAPSNSSGGPSTLNIGKDFNLDPALASDSDSKTVAGHLYEGLIRVDNGKIVPSLASSWQVSDDGLDYIVTLRQGVTFHDGKAFSADAVSANFNRWFDTASSLHGSGTYDAWVANFNGFKGETGDGGKPKSNFDGAEKVDEFTVLLHLNEPDDNFLTKLADPAFSIVSPDALAAAGFGTSGGADGGTGAYKISAWSNSGITLEPFPAYWDTANIPASNLEFKFSQ